MSIIGSKVEEWSNIDIDTNQKNFSEVIDKLNNSISKLKEGGGSISIEKQHKKGRLTARERIDYLKDSGSLPLEFGVFAGYDMYEEYGSPPAGGVIASIIKVSGVV